MSVEMYNIVLIKRFVVNSLGNGIVARVVDLQMSRRSICRNKISRNAAGIHEQIIAVVLLHIGDIARIAIAHLAGIGRRRGIEHGDASATVLRTGDPACVVRNIGRVSVVGVC